MLSLVSPVRADLFGQAGSGLRQRLSGSRSSSFDPIPEVCEMRLNSLSSSVGSAGWGPYLSSSVGSAGWGPYPSVSVGSAGWGPYPSLLVGSAGWGP